MSNFNAFFERLHERIERIGSIVSVGLDSAPNRIPEHLSDHELPRWAFNRRIIDETHEYAACYKPNAAFYEGPDGWRALRETIAYAHGKDVPVILDAKRADIGNSARQYAKVLDEMGADAITVNPYLGYDALEPFLSRDSKGVFVLCRTSNGGGADLQDLELTAGVPVYLRVARLAAEWNDRGNVGLVVGATAPEELVSIREAVPDLPFLVPGVGAQGGNAKAAVQHGLADGTGIVNSSRAIIFAGNGEAFAKAAGQAAKRLRDRLNRHR